MSERIRGRKWMAIRSRIMARDCNLCQSCKKQGKLTLATEIDHIKALANGGSNDDDNLVAICASCHETKTNDDLGYKPKVTTGLDGWPIPEEVSNIPRWRRAEGKR